MKMADKGGAIADSSGERSAVLCSNKTFWEFLRYLFVGGAAFVVDFGALVLFRELVFQDWRYGVYISVLLAFFAGHITNYLGSLWFVFLDPEERKNGWTLRAFGLFTLVGASGAGMTELGMWIGYGLLHWNYMVAKLIVASVVFTWNFVGRKLIVNKKNGA